MALIPTMHGEEMEYMKKADDTNWMSTVGENIRELESMADFHMAGRYVVVNEYCQIVVASGAFVPEKAKVLSCIVWNKKEIKSCEE